MGITESAGEFEFDDAGRERAATVLRQAFRSAQIGMPSEDSETAVDSMWIIFEALLVDHLAPDEVTDHVRLGKRTDIGNHWRRMVTTAVTHTFILSGGFVQLDQLMEVVEGKERQLADGQLWHTRRAPAQGALVLGVHTALQRLDQTASAGRFADHEDAAALEDLIALATLGSVMAGEALPSSGTESDAGPSEAKGRWARTTESVAASFGVPEVELIDVERSGWVCSDCGCLFFGRVDGGIAYPDRFAPIGRSGPCDQHISCACHQAPLQRRVR